MKYLDQPLRPDPVIEADKKDVDRTLLRENLKLTVEQRFNNLMALQEFGPPRRSSTVSISRDDRLEANGGLRR
jgi:hypothetical protein